MHGNKPISTLNITRASCGAIRSSGELFHCLHQDYQKTLYFNSTTVFMLI